MLNYNTTCNQIQEVLEGEECKKKNISIKEKFQEK